jgi:hypothetical protein
MNSAAGLAPVTPAPYALFEQMPELIEHLLGRTAGDGCDGGHRLAL